MIEVENLTKRYARTTAVDGISFTVQKGEILALLIWSWASRTRPIQTEDRRSPLMPTFLCGKSGFGGRLGRAPRREVRFAVHELHSRRLKISPVSRTSTRSAMKVQRSADLVATA